MGSIEDVVGKFDINKWRIASEKAQDDYKPEEWTPCPENCAYCSDPDYGHPHPHLTQRRLKDNMSAIDFVRQYFN
ncbi:MAG: hypothetical protein AABX79_01450 [Nanoarchaeota archaeon]